MGSIRFEVYLFLFNHYFFVNSDAVCKRSCNQDSDTECSVHIIRWQMSIGKKSVQNKMLIKKEKKSKAPLFELGDPL